MNSLSNRDALLGEIRTGEYTDGRNPSSRGMNHIRAKLATPVHLSPEIALSERLKTILLYDQAFRDHLVLVASTKYTWLVIGASIGEFI